MVKKELLRKGLLLGIGVAAYAQEKAEQLAKDLVRKGHLNKAEGKKLVRAVYGEAQQSGKRIQCFPGNSCKGAQTTGERWLAGLNRRHSPFIPAGPQ